MKKEKGLTKESARIRDQIKALLTNSYSYNNGLKKQLGIIKAVAELQKKLTVLRNKIQTPRRAQHD